MLSQRRMNAALRQDANFALTFSPASAMFAATARGALRLRRDAIAGGRRLPRNRPQPLERPRPRRDDRCRSVRPLTVDDLLPLEEYASRRQEFFDAHRRYVERCRRVRIGPRLTLVFENRRTLWYRVQEVIRVARLADRREVQEELALYNRLLPGRDRLQAALLIEVSDPSELVRELASWRGLSGEHLRLHVGGQAFPAYLVTCRPEDRTIGTAHWVQFTVPPRGRKLLASFERAAHFAFDNGAYRHDSAPLNDELRQSLVDDLDLSDRAAG